MPPTTRCDPWLRVPRRHDVVTRRRSLRAARDYRQNFGGFLGTGRGDKAEALKCVLRDARHLHAGGHRVIMAFTVAKQHPASACWRSPVSAGRPCPGRRLGPLFRVEFVPSAGDSWRVPRTGVVAPDDVGCSSLNLPIRCCRMKNWSSSRIVRPLLITRTAINIHQGYAHGPRFAAQTRLAIGLRPFLPTPLGLVKIPQFV